jgi:hypothetical protein
LFIRNRPELLISVQRGQINESEQKAATAEINSSEPMDTTATDWHEKTHQQATVSEKVESRTESVQVLTEPNVAMEIEEPALPSPAAAAVQAESNESRPQQPQRSAKRTAPPRSSRRRKHSNSSGQGGSDHEAELESKLEELRTVHKQMTKALRQMTNNYHLAAKEILGLHQQLARQEKMIETLINEVAKRGNMTFTFSLLINYMAFRCHAVKFTYCELSGSFPEYSQCQQSR